MVALIVALVLSQAEPPASATPDDDTPAAPAAPAAPAWLPQQPGKIVPEEPGEATAPSDAIAPTESPEPTEPALRRQAPPSLVNRAIFSGLGGLAGSGAGLGLTLAITGTGRTLDTTFANAMLSALLITGVAFTVHETMGGRGEVMLALLSSLVVMGSAAIAAQAIDRTVPAAPILTTLIGTVPAAALSVLALEGTSTRVRGRVQVAVSPSGGFLAFTQEF